MKKGTLGMQVEAIKLASVRRLASARLAELLTARFHRHEQELLYQGMFSSACSTLGVDQTFFPIKGAANYSLLYLALRICLETNVKRILELGAGQTSLLFNQLRKRREFEVVTLEDNVEWAARIGSMVSHEVIHSPLIHQEVRGVNTLGYDLSKVKGNFDFIIVDGPMGRPDHSRWGALSLIAQNLDPDYIVLFDDAERRGEQQSIREAMKILSGPNRPHFSLTNGLKSQAVFSSDSYSYVRFF
ncbi:hypothetical protein [Bradyrhizobium sp. 131]|uniref:hypothetical protein n=1 Tax=Bradyrhizobium sp. 131 TaxID=2782609 RepID=UPI001FFE6A98|nr:hypothetical protein [Bradyrhizobium sp. 131]UPK20965.1 hypothetical protein IVA73_08575 [Bradyrhizobium sp. 131]